MRNGGTATVVAKRDSTDRREIERTRQNLARTIDTLADGSAPPATSGGCGIAEQAAVRGSALAAGAALAITGIAIYWIWDAVAAMASAVALIARRLPAAAEYEHAATSELDASYSDKGLCPMDRAG